jgi:hypothetical protein
VLQFTYAAGKAAAYLPQTLGLGNLAKQHGYKLIPATEPLGVSFGHVLYDQFFKFVPVKNRQKLTEQAPMSYHLSILLVVLVVFISSIKPYHDPQGEYFQDSKHQFKSVFGQ